MEVEIQVAPIYSGATIIEALIAIVGLGFAQRRSVTKFSRDVEISHEYKGSLVENLIKANSAR